MAFMANPGLGSFFALAMISSVPVLAKSSAATIHFPTEAAAPSARLQKLKAAEDEAQWANCTALAKPTYVAETELKGWVLLTWLHCARKQDEKENTTTASRSALAAASAFRSLPSEPWTKPLAAEVQKDYFQLLDQDLARPGSKTKYTSLKIELDQLLQILDSSDHANKAHALRLYGDWAMAQKDFEASRDFYDQSLFEKEDGSTRDKKSQALLALGVSPTLIKQAAAPTAEFVSEKEIAYLDRFDASAKKNDLLSLAKDCIAYLGEFPQGKRANWAQDKITELSLSFLDQSRSGIEKWAALRDKLLALMGDADSSRVADWARLLHKRSDYYGSLLLAQKALHASTPLAKQDGAMLYISGRSAQLLGQDDLARQSFETYADAFSGGDDIAEVLFRLGLTDLRLKKASSAIATFERLLSLKKMDGYELGGRYWMIRALQQSSSPRAATEIASLVEKFPFSYYAMKLQAETNQGVLTWPQVQSSPPTLASLKADLTLTGPQKKSWERIRQLSASGWRSEAINEIAQFPKTRESKMKVLMAQAWNKGKAYPAVIRLLNEASDDSSEYRSKEIVLLGFPKEFEKTVTAQAKTLGLQPILVWSLMRQESAFNPKALSSSNAMGLMQLIPPTANEVAGRLGWADFDLPDDAYRVDKNITMGTSYLARMIRQFKGSVPLGLAAYNAGPTRMSQFISLRPALTGEILKAPTAALDELWIDELPWSETSFYVKAILRNTLLYRLLDQDQISTGASVWTDLVAPAVSQLDPGPKTSAFQRVSF